MTYTTVHKTYTAETFAAAAEAMLRDPDIWRIADPAVWKVGKELAVREPSSGEQAGYSVNGWEWDAEKHELTVHFR